jgi:hypothetical protein
MLYKWNIHGSTQRLLLMDENSSVWEWYEQFAEAQT